MNHDAPADRKSGSLGRDYSIFDLTALPRSAILASLASNILNLALPLVVLQIYDRIIPNQSLETLIVLISAVVVVVTLDAMLKVARSHLLGWLSAERTAAASIRAAAMVAGAPCADLSSKRATDWLDGIEAAGQIELGRPAFLN